MSQAHAAPTVRASHVSHDTDHPDLRVESGQITLTRDTRTYRVRGLERNMSSLQLIVTIVAERDGLVYVDTVNLLKARARLGFIQAVASELYIDEQMAKKDIGQLLLALEDLQLRQIEAAQRIDTVVPEMTDVEREEAITLLKDPRLVDRIVADLDQCGIVGERTNKLTGYLAAVSRKLRRPLAVMIQSASSAGKTSLMDAILGMMPEEEQVRFSGLTGQALYYLDGHDLRHKILAISESEGIGEAAYALKLLQSEGELRHATVGKNASGRMATQAYRVQGPVQLFLTTTASEIDEELANRCLVFTVDEGRDQTQAIQHQQRLAETREGQQQLHTAQRIRRLHQNAQRLLRPVEVYNPYAPQLTFTSDKTRLRRDHARYLALIRAIALLHQYQRRIYRDDLNIGSPLPQSSGGEGKGEGVFRSAPKNNQSTESINVLPSDITLANQLIAEILGRTLNDLAPQTRRLVTLIHQFVDHRCANDSKSRRDFRFTRRDLRESIGWSDFQLRTHLVRLVDLEYVLVHRGRRGRQFVYELLYDGQGQQGEPFLMGLIDPTQLHKFEHRNGKFEPSSSPH